MIEAAVLLHRGARSSEVMTPFDVLDRIEGRFGVELVGIDAAPIYGGPATLTPQRTIRTRKRFDLVIVPTLGFEVAAALQANAAFAGWIRRQSRGGATVASWCSGAFLVAAAGLLDGKKATTHWALADDFRGRFPEVDLEIGKLLVDEGDVVTAGGATSVYLLIVKLIERYAGDARSIRAARECLTDLHRPDQRAYDDGRRYARHSDPTVAHAQRYIAANLRAALSLETLAREVGTSPKTLSRRFKAAIGIAPITFVQLARVEAARRALVSTSRGVEQITLEVGYADARTFRRLFKRLTGLSPRAYRRLFASR